MDAYSLNKLAQIRQENIARACQPVPEFGYPNVFHQRRWVFRQVGKLMTGLYNVLTDLRQHYKQGQEITLIDCDQVTN